MRTDLESGTNFRNLVLEGQTKFQKRRHGIFTKPMAAPGFSSRMSKFVESTFQEDISPDYPRPKIYFAFLLDSRVDPPYHELRKLHGVSDEANLKFQSGIRLLNEWVTNSLTNEALGKMGSNRVLKPWTWAARKVPMLYRLLDAKTYQAGDSIRKSATEKDFSLALRRAYFSHDLSRLDYLVERADLGTPRNTYELASVLGERASYTRLSGLTSLADGLVAEDADSGLRRLLKTLASSILVSARGNLGVIEVALALPSILTATLFPWTPLDLMAGVVPEVAVLGSVFLHLLTHEVVHTYSNSEQYSGLVPMTTKRA